MNILFVGVALAAALLVLVLGLLVYLHLYKKHINKILCDGTRPQGKWVPPEALLAWVPMVLLVFAVCVAILDLNFDISQSRLTTRDEILADAVGWEEHNWTTIMAMTDRYAVVLSYPENHSDSSLSFYKEQDGMTLDYVFRSKMSITSVERGILMMEREGAMLMGSLNRMRLAKIVADDGTVYELDPNAPFVLIIPEGCAVLREQIEPQVYRILGYSGFTAYDENGEAVDLMAVEWCELRTIS